MLPGRRSQCSRPARTGPFARLTDLAYDFADGSGVLPLIAGSYTLIPENQPGQASSPHSCTSSSSPPLVAPGVLRRHPPLACRHYAVHPRGVVNRVGHAGEYVFRAAGYLHTRHDLAARTSICSRSPADQQCPPSRTARSSPRRRWGSARMSISTIFPCEIVKPMTDIGFPPGTVTSPTVPLTSASLVWGASRVKLSACPATAAAPRTTAGRPGYSAPLSACSTTVGSRTATSA